MKIYLPPSWVLTDEHPMATEGTPVLIDLDTRKIYSPWDRIEGVSAKQVVSLAVKARGENYLQPEEIHFVSRFKEADHKSQSGLAGHMGNKRKLPCEEIEFLRREFIENISSIGIRRGHRISSIDPGQGKLTPPLGKGNMEIKIQFETRYDLSGYEGIARINNISCGMGSPDSFKWECDLEWARGKDIPLKHVFIFSDGAFIDRMSGRRTLGDFIEMWEKQF